MKNKFDEQTVNELGWEKRDVYIHKASEIREGKLAGKCTGQGNFNCEGRSNSETLCVCKDTTVFKTTMASIREMIFKN